MGFKGDGVNAQIISAAQLNSNISENTFSSMLKLSLIMSWGNCYYLITHCKFKQLFYQDRKNAQVKQSIFNPDDFSLMTTC